MILKANIRQAFSEQIDFDKSDFKSEIDLTETENKLQLNSLLEKFSHIKSICFNESKLFHRYL
jgi:hypothetical protein